jgi:hypothetical protein
MSLVIMPKILQEKLGDDGAEELVKIINASIDASKTGVVLEGTFEKRLSETEEKISKEITDARVESMRTKADLIKWMFVFWAGQIVIMLALFGFVYHGK